MDYSLTGLLPRGRLLTVIAGNSELQERAAFKHTCLAGAMTDALRERGVPDPTARPAAELGVRAFDDAFDLWSDPAEQRTLADLARRTLDELRAAIATLD
ncbi:hypothetical protein ITP53_03050 [Nonomuraea sp. K274]|uniref:Uncharacterized protein n=1 Tax=Nonomuraea cypriaca TaxID=1187855 RepID=A0A931A4P2_9ACTN|nr:hypothetical protein [Nonomuraea cypriaca]MBF8184734.1 hypothetical protein [Nonomuraea cypriaca]